MHSSVKSFSNTDFITAGLIQSCIDNDDELAMVLRHEISHLILDHMSEMKTLAVFFNAIGVMIFSLDPTERMFFKESIRSLVEEEFSSIEIGVICGGVAALGGGCACRIVGGAVGKGACFIEIFFILGVGWRGGILCEAKMEEGRSRSIYSFISCW